MRSPLCISADVFVFCLCVSKGFILPVISVVVKNFCMHCVSVLSGLILSNYYAQQYAYTYIYYRVYVCV